MAFLTFMRGRLKFGGGTLSLLLQFGSVVEILSSPVDDSDGQVPILAKMGGVELPVLPADLRLA